MGLLTSKKQFRSRNRKSISCRYRVLGLVGSGGFGDVYSIERLQRKDEEISAVFAMKTEIKSVDGSNIDRLNVRVVLFCC